jgi:hypothetical protein
VKIIIDHAPSIASLIVLAGCSLAAIFTETDQIVISLLLLLSGLVFGVSNSVPVSLFLLWVSLFQVVLNDFQLHHEGSRKAFSAVLAYDDRYRANYCLLLFNSFGVIGASAAVLFRRVRKGH